MFPLTSWILVSALKHHISDLNPPLGCTTSCAQSQFFYTEFRAPSTVRLLTRSSLSCSKVKISQKCPSLKLYSCITTTERCILAIASPGCASKSSPTSPRRGWLRRPGGRAIARLLIARRVPVEPTNSWSCVCLQQWHF